MRLAFGAVILSLATAAAAQMTPGSVVQSGQAFPIVADFNGDGLDDLVQERNVLVNNGASLDQKIDLGLPDDERVVAVLDVNGDHILDLLTKTVSAMLPPSLGMDGHPGDPVYRLYVGNAARQYANPIDVASGPQPYVADVDGDGKDDLLLFAEFRPDGVRTTATDVTILRSRGDGTFERLAPFRIAASPQFDPGARVLAGDVNHDGVIDLVIRCVDGLEVLRGTGGGHFAVDDHYIPLNTDLGWWSTQLADVDGDGNLDVMWAGWRSVRVFYGDGRGNFPRMTKTSIAKVHDIVGFPQGVPINVDELNQPRSLAVGHFTRGDQMQVAGGMAEGDLVVLSYEQGAMREVSRRSTDFWLLDVRPGTFHRSSGTDLYVMGTLIWGDVYPRPRLFYGQEGLAVTNAAVHAPARRRASRVGTSDTAMRIAISGDCVDPSTQRFVFARDGVFGVARTGDMKIDAVFDGPHLYVRVAAPYAQEPAQIDLTQSGDSYSGTGVVLTQCGWKTMAVNATME